MISWKKLFILIFTLALILPLFSLTGCPSPPTITTSGMSTYKLGSGIPLTIDTRWTLGDAYIIVDYDGKTSYMVTPQTLMAYGGSPISGYTWSKPTGGRFPPIGTIVDPNGVFRGTGGAMAEGTYTFDVEVSDGSHTATAEYTINIIKKDFQANPIQDPIAANVDIQPRLPSITLVDGIAGQPYGSSLFCWAVPPTSWFLDTADQSNFALSGLTIDMAGGIVRGTINSSMSGKTIKFRVIVEGKDYKDPADSDERDGPLYIINVK